MEIASKGISNNFIQLVDHLTGSKTISIAIKLVPAACEIPISADPETSSGRLCQLPVCLSHPVMPNLFWHL